MEKKMVFVPNNDDYFSFPKSWVPDKMFIINFCRKRKPTALAVG
jgi:hypothetical protein